MIIGGDKAARLITRHCDPGIDPGAAIQSGARIPGLPRRSASRNDGGEG